MTRSAITPVPLYIVGAGGFGRETLDVVLALGRQADGFIDERADGTVRGLPVLAPEELAAPAEFVVGIAAPEARSRLAARCLTAGLRPVTLVHPRAAVGPETRISPGCVVLANSYVSSDVQLGGHVHINYNATVGHDAVLEDFVTVLPGANVAGGVLLREGATVGSNASVLQGRSVGRGAVIGAGAVVTTDVADGSVVAGVPARPLPSAG